MESAVSVYDVAARAGVSPSTVSRAFSRPDLVSEKTRKRVLETAEAMNFSVSRSSIALKSGQTFRIALLLSATITTWFNSNVFAGLNDVFHPAGYDLSVYPIGGTQNRKEFFDTLPARRNADAVVVPSFNIDSNEVSRLKTMNVPIAGINTSSHADMEAWAAIDDCEGLKMAMRHLLSLGHRRITYICRDPQSSLPFSTSQRLRGFHEICDESGIEPVVVTVPDNDDHMAITFNKLMALPQLPTAICCQEDGIAIPIMCKLRDFGLRIPTDISIIGFDDSTFSMELGLTTIRQDPYAMGASVASKILTLIANKTLDNPYETFPLEMLVRSSTAPAPRQ